MDASGAVIANQQWFTNIGKCDGVVISPELAVSFAARPLVRHDGYCWRLHELTLVTNQVRREITYSAGRK
jgi:hypothetical protein